MVAISSRHITAIVTPLVDVLLVLLVVFKDTAPLPTVGVPVDLPKTNASQMVGQDEPLVISVNAKGEVFPQETKITLEQLVRGLEAITQNKKDTRIFVRGDRAIAYGQVMEMMGTVNLALYLVALVTQLPQGDGVEVTSDRCDTALPFPHCCTA